MSYRSTDREKAPVEDSIQLVCYIDCAVQSRGSVTHSRCNPCREDTPNWSFSVSWWEDTCRTLRPSDCAEEYGDALARIRIGDCGSRSHRACPSYTTRAWKHVVRDGWWSPVRDRFPIVSVRRSVLPPSRSGRIRTCMRHGSTARRIGHCATLRNACSHAYRHHTARCRGISGRPEEGVEPSSRSSQDRMIDLLHHSGHARIVGLLPYRTALIADLPPRVGMEQVRTIPDEDSLRVVPCQWLM